MSAYETAALFYLQESNGVRQTNFPLTTVTPKPFIVRMLVQATDILLPLYGIPNVERELKDWGRNLVNTPFPGNEHLKSAIHRALSTVYASLYDPWRASPCGSFNPTLNQLLWLDALFHVLRVTFPVINHYMGMAW